MNSLGVVFDQIIDGFDIPSPASLLRMKASRAAQHQSRMPYSLLTNLAHTVLWQDYWLDKLKGGPKTVSMEMYQQDFRVPNETEWDGLRKRLIEGLREARDIAKQLPQGHELESESQAQETLIRIAVHASYHLGQMNLLKRSLAIEKKSRTAN